MFYVSKIKKIFVNRQELGLPKQIPRTIENTRTPNDDQVDADDEEIQLDESLDEMSAYFSKQIPPKVLITSSHNSHRRTIRFCRELRDTIIGSELRWRKKCPLKKLVKCANERGYTDILVVNEDWSKPSKYLDKFVLNLPTNKLCQHFIRCLTTHTFTEWTYCLLSAKQYSLL